MTESHQAATTSDLDEVIDFFNKLNAQFRAGIATYVEAVRQSEGVNEPLEEGSEAPFPSPDMNVNSMAEMARKGLEGMSLLTGSFKDDIAQRIQKGEENEEDISLGSVLLGSGVGLSLEWFEFPESLHKTLVIKQDGQTAQFDVFPASDHFNFSPNAVIRLNIVRKDQGWLLSSAKYALE